MPENIEIIRSVADLRHRINGWRREGLSLGLVPTMGALHEGHFSLVDQSIRTTDRTVVTLFVNPRQFAPDEDFDVYPRNEAADATALAVRGVHVLFAPPVEEMYVDGAVTTVSVPGIGDLFDGAFRPGFFTGVATVVAKLMIQSLPDRAFFGEKDYQQFQVIKRMARDLDLPVEAVGCPIVREDDGLAMSSRNAYLSAEERQTAKTLYQVLTAVAQTISTGGDIKQTVEAGKTRLLVDGFASIDYLVVVDPETLEELDNLSGDARILVAAWIGKTRLIDNLAVAAS